jgi:GNAT superfamily N-acetyltransferase
MTELSASATMEEDPVYPEAEFPFELKEPTAPEEWAAAFALRQEMLNYPEYGNDAGEDEIDHKDTTSSVIAVNPQGQIVGTGRVSVSEHLAKISRMAVEPASQGRLVGEALVKSLEAKAASMGARAIELNTADAEDFYLKPELGYKTLEHTMVSLGGGQIKVARMHKELGEK